MSRGGYYRLEKNLKEKKLGELMSSGSNPDMSIDSIEIERHIKWKEGRLNSTGSYVNEKVAEVAKKIVRNL